jgi:hypothetical protein
MNVEEFLPLTTLLPHQQLHTLRCNAYIPGGRGFYILLRGTGPDLAFYTASGEDNLAYGYGTSLAEAVQCAQNQLDKQYERWLARPSRPQNVYFDLLSNFELDL